MGLFDKLKKNFKKTDKSIDDLVLPKARVDILEDIDSLLNDIIKYKLIEINPDLYKKYNLELTELREKWNNNEESRSEKSLSTRGEIINRSVALRFEIDGYIKNEGKAKLIELFVKRIYDGCDIVLKESNGNMTNFIDLLNRLQGLSDSYQEYDFLKNSEKLSEKINKTRYTVMKNGYYLNRDNATFEFSEEMVKTFNKYIIHDVYNFIQQEYSDVNLRKIQEELELAILFGNLDDVDNLKKMFTLMQKTNGSAFFTSYVEEKIPDIELKLLPDNVKVEVDEANNKIMEVTNKIRELQVYDGENYRKFLVELSKLKIDFYKNQNDSKMINDINLFVNKFEEYFNSIGKEKQYSQLVDSTLLRIKGTDSLESLVEIAKEVSEDPYLSKIRVLNETLKQMYERRKNTVFAFKKDDKDMSNLGEFQNDIVKNAQWLIMGENNNPDLPTNKKVVDKISRLLNQEITNTSLQQLFVLINYYENNTIDYINYAQSYADISAGVTTMIKEESSEYKFEIAKANANNSVVRITQNNNSTSMKCAGYIPAQEENVDVNSVLSNPNTINLIGIYNLDKLVSSHETQVINLIGGSANTVVNDGLIPIFMLNRGFNNNLTIEQIRAYINEKLLNIKKDSKVFNALIDPETFGKVKYIIEEYSETYSETLAESSLLTVIPGLENIDLSYLELKIFFSYHHDLEYLNKIYETHLKKGTIEKSGVSM